MVPVLLGLLTALLWGGADVLSRHTGRALGADGALFGMMTAGAAGLSVWIWVTGQPWPGLPSWWTVGAASLAAANMLLYYEAMRRGPVSLVSPAVSAYPAWAVLLTMALGVIPGLSVLVAMAITLLGVLLVARYAVTEPDPGEAPGRSLTLILALTASVMFAFTLLASQRAIAEDGMVPVLWWGRVVGVVAMLPLLASRARPRRIAPASAALSLLQGLLDTAGLVFLFAAGSGIDGALATVSSSAFGAVTVLFARLLYRERLSPGQGAGIGAVTLGVVALALLG